MKRAQRTELSEPRCSMECVRRVAINYPAIADESGMTKGRIVHSPWAGWVVINTTGNPEWPDMATITPPLMERDETELRVGDGCWCFYAPNPTDEPR